MAINTVIATILTALLLISPIHGENPSHNVEVRQKPNAFGAARNEMLFGRSGIPGLVILTSMFKAETSSTACVSTSSSSIVISRSTSSSKTTSSSKSSSRSSSSSASKTSSSSKTTSSSKSSSTKTSSSSKTSTSSKLSSTTSSKSSSKTSSTSTRKTTTTTSKTSTKTSSKTSTTSKPPTANPITIPNPASTGVCDDSGHQRASASAVVSVPSGAASIDIIIPGADHVGEYNVVLGSTFEDPQPKDLVTFYQVKGSGSGPLLTSGAGGQATLGWENSQGVQDTILTLLFKAGTGTQSWGIDFNADLTCTNDAQLCASKNLPLVSDCRRFAIPDDHGFATTTEDAACFQNGNTRWCDVLSLGTCQVSIQWNVNLLGPGTQTVHDDLLSPVLQSALANADGPCVNQGPTAITETTSSGGHISYNICVKRVGIDCL